MKSSIQDIYEKHHLKNRPRGTVFLEKDRSIFLSNKVGKNKRVLDIGCRDGSLTKYFLENNDVLGIDIDSKALEYAKEFFNIKTRQIDLNGEWDLPKNNFDVVVCAEVLEHLYHPSKIIQQIKEVLKKDGVLLGSVPNAFSFINRIRLFFAQKKNTPLNDPTHINHFSFKELKSLLNEHFSDVKLYPCGRFSKLDKFFPGLFSFDIMFEAKNKKY